MIGKQTDRQIAMGALKAVVCRFQFSISPISVLTFPNFIQIPTVSFVHSSFLFFETTECKYFSNAQIFLYGMCSELCLFIDHGGPVVAGAENKTGS